MLKSSTHAVPQVRSANAVGIDMILHVYDVRGFLKKRHNLVVSNRQETISQ